VNIYCGDICSLCYNFYNYCTQTNQYYLKYLTTTPVSYRIILQSLHISKFVNSMINLICSPIVKKYMTDCGGIMGI